MSATTCVLLGRCTSDCNNETVPATEHAVYRLSPAMDEAYARLEYRHPRNRGIDWVELERYVRGETAAQMAGLNVFVKTDRPLDAVSLTASGPIVSQRAREVFESVAGDDIAFVPLLVNWEAYWGMRVTRVLPEALDVERSGLWSNVMMNGAVWRASAILYPALFRIPQKPTAVFATESVVQAYEAAGCTGISFSPVGEVVDT
jgi:hypothetical protein